VERPKGDEDGMSFAELIDWFSQTNDISTRVFEHMRLSYFPVLAAIVIAFPIGLYIGHARRFEFAAVTIANLGRAIPSFAILALALPISIELGLGLGFWPTFTALFLLALPPIMTNTYIGVRNVDVDTVESARGMGLSERQLLGAIEIPLAAPLIIAGVRTAAVQSVATATLGALVAGGGLGEYIRLGFRASVEASLVGGALLVAILAIATEVALGFVQRAAQPKTSQEGPEKLEPFEEASQVARPVDARIGF
jgi:osmoprotectant transport system permease protein